MIHQYVYIHVISAPQTVTIRMLQTIAVETILVIDSVGARKSFVAHQNKFKINSLCQIIDFCKYHAISGIICSEQVIVAK